MGITCSSSMFEVGLIHLMQLHLRGDLCRSSVHFTTASANALALRSMDLDDFSNLIRLTTPILFISISIEGPSIVRMTPQFLHMPTAFLSHLFRLVVTGANHDEPDEARDPHVMAATRMYLSMSS